MTAKIFTKSRLTLTNVRGLRVRRFIALAFASFLQIISGSAATNGLINVNFGAHLNPGLNAIKTGAAATGLSVGDFWNFYSRDDGSGGFLVDGTVINLKLADGTITSAGLVVNNAPGCWANSSTDPMYNTFVYPFGGNASVTITNLSAGTYDLYVYAHDGNYQLNVGGASYGTKTCRDNAPTGAAIWQEGRQYVKYTGVVVASGQTLTLTVLTGLDGYAVISGLQLAFNATPPPPPSGFLVDVDFGSGAGPSPKAGLAATGQTTNDFWNFYTRDGAGGWLTFGAVSNLKLVNSTATSVGMTVANAPGAWGNGSSDPMYNGYIYPFSGNATVTVTNLPVGQYDLYVYANDGNYQVTGATDYGVKTSVDFALVSPPVWQAGVQYALYHNVTVTNSTQPVVLTVRPGVSGYAIISGLQIAASTSVVTNTPPSITGQPISQSVFAGANAGFSVTAGGTSPLAYQWRLNGTNIAGATGSSITLNSVQVGQSGNYSVRVTNVAGAVVSFNAALTVVQSITNELLNVNFGAHLNPGLGLNGVKTGPAAIGKVAEDVWNFYSRDDGNGGFLVNSAVTNLKLADGTATTIGLTVNNAPGAWANGSSDPMYNSYLYPFSGTATMTFTNLLAGTYGLLVYSHDGNYQLSVGGTDYGIKTCRDNVPNEAAFWQEGRQYVRYTGVTVATGQTLTLTVQPGLDGYAIISGLQLTFTAAPITPLPTDYLVDVDFGGGSVTSSKSGFAATGQTTNDFWNFYTRDDGAGGWLTFGALSNLKLVNGTPTTSGLTVDNAPGAWGNGSSDPMYDGYIYPFSGNATVTVTNLPIGHYSFYVYANDGNYQMTGAADYGTKTSMDTALVSPPAWQAGVQYALFQNVAVTNSTQTVVLTVRPGNFGYAIISGLQIAKTNVGTNHCDRLTVHCKNGHCVKVRFPGNPSKRHHVQASTDMKHWVNIGCAMADDDGNCEFEDRDSNKFSTRYYRIVP